MRLRHTVVITFLAVLAQSAVMHGAVTAWTAVTVRVYDANSVISGTSRIALDQARKTLEAASIDVVWRVCDNAASRCNAAMAPGELAIRIVRSHMPDKYHGTLPLGDALINRQDGEGVLATIYVDRVMWLANEAGSDCNALLGRAIAHELGHLLLGTTTHGPVGLMRAMWSQDEVRHGHARDWAFAPGELSAMSMRARARQIETSRGWGTR